MSRVVKYSLPVILFCTFSIFACKKTSVEQNELSKEVLNPPPPPCQWTPCNVTDGGQFFYWFAWGTSSYEGELHYELSGQPAPRDFVYDQNGNPLSTVGESNYTCYTKHFNSTFTYTNGKLSSILIDNTYSEPGCPGYMNLPNIHTATRLDFTYTMRAEQTGGFPILYPVTNVTAFKSDTVALGQNFNSFTPTGRTYYYEYNIPGDKLRVKRYKANASAVVKEVKYTYDSVGRLIKRSQFENGVEKHRYSFYGFDGKKNFTAGNSITKLLTSTYGNNNPKQWSVQYFPNMNTDYLSAVYLYNGNCYPIHADITLNGFTYDYVNISYSCN